MVPTEHIDKVRISYRDFPQAGYVILLSEQTLPELPRKGQVVIIGGVGKRVKIKKRTVRREGKTLHVAFDVLEISNA